MVRGKTIHFLLTYDRSEQRLVNMRRFHNGQKAVDAYGGRSASTPADRTSRSYCWAPTPNVPSASRTQATSRRICRWTPSLAGFAS